MEKSIPKTINHPKNTISPPFQGNQGYPPPAPDFFSPYLRYETSGELCIDEIKIRELAETYGTPLYVTSFGTLLRNFEIFRDATLAHGFKRSLICFAMKANGSQAVIRMLGKLGCGTDIVSKGELQQSLQAGIDPSKIIFSGVGKTLPEIEQAVQEKILLLNIESEAEMKEIAEFATQRQIVIPVSIRINPDIEAHTHPHIQTGNKDSKFGVSIATTKKMIQEYFRHPFLDLQGFGFHLGSQIREHSCFRRAIAKITSLLQLCKNISLPLRFFHVGGGLAIRYAPDDIWAENIADYLQSLEALQKILGADTTYLFEPGRFLIGNAGFLLGRITRYKKVAGRTILVTDAAMDNLIRPAFYDGYHHIYPASLPEALAKSTSDQYDVVGPICESADYLAKKRNLRLQKNPPENLLLFTSTGGYSSVLASNYNGRLRAAEAMVWKNRHALTRHRESVEDLWRRDIPIDSNLETAIIREGQEKDTPRRAREGYAEKGKRRIRREGQEKDTPRKIREE